METPRDTTSHPDPADLRAGGRAGHLGMLAIGLDRAHGFKPSVARG
jgi:hypothetical protein